MGLHSYQGICIRLKADAPSELAEVKVVKYELPTSFNEPSRFSTESPFFPIEVWTPVFFDIIARVVRRDGSEEIVEGRIQWPDGLEPKMILFGT